RLPRADRGHSRTVARGVGQGGAARPRRHDSRARRLPRRLPAGRGRGGGAGRRPPPRRPPRARPAPPPPALTRPPRRRPRAPPPASLQEPARRARALGGLLVADEVQAGYGRSGTGLWSFQAAGIEPDMVVMGKPMGNGFPVAALVARSQVLEAVPEEVELFSTYGGNPVACAAALAVLAVIEDEGLVANAAEVGTYLRQGLASLAGRHPVIGDVRGEGLLLGVELTDETGAPAAARARGVTEAMRDRGVLISATGPAGDVLKIRPPLVFRRDHADLLLQALDDVLGSSREEGATP